MLDKSKLYKIKTRVVQASGIGAHGFNEGEKVVIIDYDERDNSYECQSQYRPDQVWWVCRENLIKVNNMGNIKVIKIANPEHLKLVRSVLDSNGFKCTFDTIGSRAVRAIEVEVNKKEYGLHNHLCGLDNEPELGWTLADVYESAQLSIGSYKVIFNKDSITVGCQEVSNEMVEMIANKIKARKQ